MHLTHDEKHRCASCILTYLGGWSIRGSPDERRTRFSHLEVHISGLLFIERKLGYLSMSYACTGTATSDRSQTEASDNETPETPETPSSLHPAPATHNTVVGKRTPQAAIAVRSEIKTPVNRTTVVGPQQRIC